MTKTKVNRNVLNPQYLENLESLWIASPAEVIAEGRAWYRNARAISEQIARHCNLRLEQVAGVIAALSPGRNWNLNLVDAIKVCQAYARREELPMVGSYGRLNLEKAKKILEGAAPMWVLGGPKVKAFYQNICNPEGRAVCMDRHMKSILFGAPLADKASVIRPYEYDWFAEHVRSVADAAGVLPNVLQAVTWVAWRRMKKF